MQNSLRTTDASSLLGALALAGLLSALSGCALSHTPGGGGGSDGGGGREPCGPVVCGRGQVCCNSSCGICTAPGEGCVAIACVDAGPGERYCSSFIGGDCGFGEYCDYGDLCRVPDAGGVCRPIPRSCDSVWDPVCGCDEVTYGNACEAAAAGRSVLHRGECEGPPPLSCGGFADEGCPDDMFCDFPEETYCGGFDIPGTCRLRPADCPEPGGVPVCGCDGRDYISECQANFEGTDVAVIGPCDEEGG